MPYSNIAKLTKASEIVNQFIRQEDVIISMIGTTRKIPASIFINLFAAG